jgi:Protein of unknown function (DUF2630)
MGDRQAARQVAARLNYDRIMSDETIATTIEKLVAEEHDLRLRESADRTVGEDALEDDRQRLREVEVELDRCWDLLRQRRALRSAGQDPEEAHARDAGTVEGYLQ